MRKFLSFMLCIMLVLASFSIAFATDISINGNVVTYTEQSGVPFIDSASRTQVPFRQTLEAFGCEVDWDNTNKIACAKKDGIKVEVPIGASYILKDGVQIPNDTAALNKGGRTYLPIRVVLEAFGYTVNYDNATKTVVATNGEAPYVAPTTLPEITITAIDCGQGDSIFIDAGEYEVLIDASTSGYGKTVSNYIRPFVDGRLDLVIGTHAHADHIGGLPQIYEDYDVAQTIYSGEDGSSATYSKFVSAAQNEPNSVFIADSDMSFNLGDLGVQIIEILDNDSNCNNNSVASLFTYGNVKFLACGDSETEAENIIATKVSDVDIWKAGHHGSSTANSSALLSVIKPEITLVSAGVGNTYGHPHLAALNRLLDYGTAYGTFKSGNIVITTNGETYSVSSNISPLTTSDAGSLGSNEVKAPSNNTPISTHVESGSYVGNGKTLKVHVSNCKSVSSMSEHNKVYGNDLEWFKAHGYSACQNCHPF